MSTKIIHRRLPERRAAAIGEGKEKAATGMEALGRRAWRDTVTRRSQYLTSHVD
jgi:hypothetical protein